MPDLQPPSTPRFAELGQFRVDPESVRLLGYETCMRRHVVVLGVVDAYASGPVTVGMLEPGDAALLDEVSRMLGREVRPVPLNADEIEQALERGWGLYQEARGAGGTVEITIRPVERITVARDVPATRIVDELLGHALHRGASDLHIEVYEDDVDVRLRVDGTLEQMRTPLGPRNVRAVVSRLKVLAGLDISERRRAQDGRVMAEVHGADGAKRDVDFRLSVVPGPFGEDAVLRILDTANVVIGLDGLGMGGAELAVFRDLVSNPEGLVLVTGPTGSGKTTTLYSALAHVNTPANKILTAEDPVEYPFPKINQKQVSAQMGFADYARSFLRQDPDVILIGEIRDEATAEVAVRAAQTGHLVLSTLHTIDAIRTVSRLDTLGVERGLTANTLIASVSQRLARRLCAECRVETAPDDALRRRLRLAADAGPFFTAAGCPTCGGDGLRGRVGLFEMFVPDAHTADLIADGAPAHDLRAVAIAGGMRTLLDDALDKARAGLVPLSEIVRVVPYRMVAEAARGGD